jgi:hypothetical protein
VKDAKACDERKLLIQLKSSMEAGIKPRDVSCKWLKTGRIEVKDFCEREILPMMAMRTPGRKRQ